MYIYINIIYIYIYIHIYYQSHTVALTCADCDSHQSRLGLTH